MRMFIVENTTVEIQLSKGWALYS